MNVKLSFEVKKLPLFSVSHKNERKTFEIQAFDGILTVSVQYDYERAPLSLNGEIALGDRVEVVMLDHRIELYINGELKDEEWPAGNRLFEIGDLFTPELEVYASEYIECNADAPTVSSTFENAEGWYVTGNAGAASGTDLTLDDTAQNAKYLRSTYYWYYWYRNDVTA